MALLSIENLEVSYGLIRAIKGISLEVNEGEIVSLIGANGAGKTTTMHALCNLLPKQNGRAVFDGTDITNMPAHRLVPLGISQVPEGRRIFGELTVAENLRLGAYTRHSKQEYAETIARIYERFPILRERSRQIAGTLSGGEQQMLAMSRALMAHPRLLLLDEPSMGLSPLYVSEVFDMIRKIREDGTTILLVEQNAKKALSISDRAYVLEIGRITRSGTGAELLADDAIRRAYLGD